MEIEPLILEFIESKTLLARIDQRLKHMEDEQKKILDQTMMTNGRVTKLEKIDIDGLISDIENLKTKVQELEKVQDNYDVQKDTSKKLKEKWLSNLKWAGWVIAAIVYLFSNEEIRSLLRALTELITR